MVSNVSVSDSKKISPAFCGNKSKEKISPAEKFINDVNKTVKTQEEGNFFSKYCWSQTASMAAGIPLLGYEAYYLLKLRSAGKAGGKEAKQAFISKMKKPTALIFAGAALLYAGLEYIFSRNADKKYEKFTQDFVDINTSTEAKLRNQVIRSNIIGAMCSPIKEEIIFNKNLVLDPISKRKLKKLIKHELVHARQYETIARSKDGIKKLNYGVLSSVAKSMDTSKAKAEFEDIYRDITSDTTGKYDNVTLHITGADVDLKKYIEGIHTILTDKNAGMDDVPIVIDKEHYEKLREAKGDLTPEEEKKAEQYYEAQLNYPKLSFRNMINPFSPYYNNLLEREAYKESPNFITFIRHLFVKD